MKLKKSKHKNFIKIIIVFLFSTVEIILLINIIYIYYENSPINSNDLKIEITNTETGIPSEEELPALNDTAKTTISFSILPDLEPPHAPIIEKIGNPIDQYTYNVLLSSEYDASIFINNVFAGKVNNEDGTFEIALHLEPGDNLFQLAAEDFSHNKSSISDTVLNFSPDEHDENKFTIIETPINDPIQVYYPTNTIGPSTQITNGGGGGINTNNSIPNNSPIYPIILVQKLQIYPAPSYPPHFQNPDGRIIPENARYLPIPSYLPVGLYTPPGTYLPGGAYTPNDISYIAPETIIPLYTYLPIGTYLPGGAYLPVSPFMAELKNIPPWINSEMISILGENIAFIGNTALIPTELMTINEDGTLRFYEKTPLTTNSMYQIKNYDFANPFLINSENLWPQEETPIETQPEIKDQPNVTVEPETKTLEPEITVEPEGTNESPIQLEPEIRPIYEKTISEEITSTTSIETEYEDISTHTITPHEFTFNTFNTLQNTIVLKEKFTLPSDMLLIEPMQISDSITLITPIKLSEEMYLVEDILITEDIILSKNIKLPENASLKKWESFLPSTLYASLLKFYQDSEDNIILLRGTTLPKGTILPKGTTLPKGTVLPKGTTLPKGTVLPKGTILPPNTTLPKGTSLYIKEENTPDTILTEKNDKEEKVTEELHILRGKRPTPKPNINSIEKEGIPLPPPLEIVQGIKIESPNKTCSYTKLVCENSWLVPPVTVAIIYLIYIYFIKHRVRDKADIHRCKPPK